MREFRRSGQALLFEVGCSLPRMSLRVETGFDHLRDALADVFSREIEFPLGVLVTVLSAKVTANTGHAKITLSVFPEDAKEGVHDLLRSEDRHIKDALAKQVRLRRIPRLHYVFDDTEAHAEEIERALHTLEKDGEFEENE